jgi:hypothetical protein
MFYFFFYIISYFLFIYIVLLPSFFSVLQFQKQTNKLHGLSPRANYTDRATILQFQPNLNLLLSERERERERESIYQSSERVKSSISRFQQTYTLSNPPSPTYIKVDFAKKVCKNVPCPSLAPERLDGFNPYLALTSVSNTGRCLVSMKILLRITGFEYFAHFLEF